MSRAFPRVLATELCRGPPKDFETNSPSVAHVGYDISTPSRVKFNSLECRNIVTHGQQKENIYVTCNKRPLLKKAISHITSCWNGCGIPDTRKTHVCPMVITYMYSVLDLSRRGKAMFYS